MLVWHPRYRRPCLALGTLSGGRQLTDDGAGSPLGAGEVELRLEVHPELGIDAEPMAEPYCGVAGYGTLAGDDLADSGWEARRSAVRR